MTCRYMEPNNDIINACLNQIYNTEQQHLEYWRNSLHDTKYLSSTDEEEIIRILKVQMCRLNHKDTDDKHKDEYIHEQNADSG